MTRQEQLEFCKKCKNRKKDFQQGLLCSITGEKADFENTCEHYNHDETISETVTDSDDVADTAVLEGVDQNIIDKLKTHQDFYYAIIGGLLASILSAVIWATITVATEMQIGYMAIGVGLLVGFSVRFFGAGIDQKFGYLGAILSLFGCLTGNLFSQVAFFANEASMSYLEILSMLSFSDIVDVLSQTFSPIDILFYGIALYEGYKLAFRKISALEIKMLHENKSEGFPANYKLRLPLVIVSILVMGSFIITVNNGVSGFKTYHYESGKRMSEGEMVHSKEDGKWTYWYENGNTQLVAHFSKGTPNGLWQWYNEDGQMIKQGHYKMGLEDSIWFNYHENGAVLDSGKYINGRKTGTWKNWYNTSKLLQEGKYERDRQVGLWKSYHENGQLATIGEIKESIPVGEWLIYFENGQLETRMIHESREKLIIKDVWNKKGKQLVKNGNGTYKTYYPSGQLSAEGKVKDGLRYGKWISYYTNGKKREIGEYENEIYKIQNSWDSEGKAMVVDGNGDYQSYYDDETKIHQTGQVLNGLREGTWSTLYESTQSLYQVDNYKAGRQLGESKVYYETGELYASGQMKDNIQDGEWNWYYISGVHSSKVTFRNGKKEGTQIMWGEDGKKTKEEYYANGELIEEKVF
ncbi:MAG: hypothetical protein N4A71_16220 [Carboxylicivirga sp.]|jgi:antitoxin component YwqK of YwqJK toxin-antitoxin module|nr:hypothetical protein [Carboxylicivirga sp.]